MCSRFCLYNRLRAGDHWSPLQWNMRTGRKNRAYFRVIIIFLHIDFTLILRTDSTLVLCVDFTLILRTDFTLFCRGDQWSPALYQPIRRNQERFPRTNARFPATAYPWRKSIPLPYQKVLGIPKTLSQKGLRRGSGQSPARPSRPLVYPRRPQSNGLVLISRSNSLISISKRELFLMLLAMKSREERTVV